MKKQNYITYIDSTDLIELLEGVAQTEQTDEEDTLIIHLSDGQYIWMYWVHGQNFIVDSISHKYLNVVAGDTLTVDDIIDIVTSKIFS